MNRATLKSIIAETIQEISSDTMRQAAVKARSVDKHTQANRFYDAAEKKDGTNRGEELAKKLGNAPVKFKLTDSSSSTFSGVMSGHAALINVELVGLYKRGNTTYIEFLTGGIFGKLRVKGEIIVSTEKDGSPKFLLYHDGKMPSYTDFDRNGVIAMHKITGIPVEKIPKLDSMREGREKIKESIRKIVIREMTQANLFKTTHDSTSNTELPKEVKKAIGKSGEAETNTLNGKVVVDDGVGGKKFQVEITESGEGLFDVNIIKNGSDRVRARQIDSEKLAEFLRDNSKDEESYTDKAFKKGKAPIKNKEEEDKEKVSSPVDEKDGMEETKEETQLKTADKETKKADEKSVKDVAPIDDDVAPQLGGELVDKIEKIIDRVLKAKNKAEPKSAFLKADKDMESSDKRVVKQKDTPALKDAKKK